MKNATYFSFEEVGNVGADNRKVLETMPVMEFEVYLRTNGGGWNTLTRYHLSPR